MKNPNADIYEMLDTLSLPVAAQRFMELSKSPELCNYTAMQFIREVLEPQYIETLNNRFETNLRLSSILIGLFCTRKPNYQQAIICTYVDTYNYKFHSDLFLRNVQAECR